MSRIPLALLPGTLCSAMLWAKQIDALHDVADVCVLDTAQHDTLAALAQHVHDVMPPRFAVAGLSYGGIVALAVWRHKPAAISHLALLNTTPLPVTPKKRAAQEGMVEQARAGGFDQIAAEQADTLLALTNRQYAHEYRAKIIAMAEEVGVEGFANQINAQVNRPDSRPILGEIACPTLVLCVAQDTLCPPELHGEMAEQIPDSMLRIVAECGHLSTIEQPDAVAQAMRELLLSPDTPPTMNDMSHRKSL